MVSFASPQQIDLVAGACQSFALDNGAFSAWRSGTPITDWEPYYDFVEVWKHHPGFDFALIPDVIDGTEDDNARYIATWPCGTAHGCPIWHLHESLYKLQCLLDYEWPRIAIGSSGEYAQIGTPRWWHRMDEAMKVVCPFGMPIRKLHGLRMLDPDIFTRFPFSSADSTNVARNIGIDRAWTGSYPPANKSGRGVVIADRIEAFNSSDCYKKAETQTSLFEASELTAVGYTGSGEAVAP
jgi:hypothetical protein